MNEIARRDQIRLPESRTASIVDVRESELLRSLDVRRIIKRLAKRTPQIAIVTVLVLVPAAIATYMATPLFKSTALVEVSPDPVQVLPYRDVGDTVVGGANYDNYMGTQEQILKSDMLRLRVRRRLESEFVGQPASAETNQLADRFALKQIDKSELFQLDYLAPAPAVAATMVNLYAEEYINHNFELRQNTRVKAEQDLKKELESLERRLQLSEKELMTYAETNNIFSLEQGQVDPLQQRLASLNQEVSNAEVQVASARSSFESLQKASTTTFPQRLSTDQISQLSGKAFQLEQELTTLRGTFGENWPAVTDKRREVAVVSQQLAEEKSAVLARNLEQARLDFESAEARRQLAVQSLDEQKHLVNQFHNASIQYNILKRDVDTNRNLHEGLLQRLRQTGVLAGFQFGNIQIIEPGQPSSRADSPNVPLNLGLATLLGLSLGICLVILLDAWDTSISTLEEVDELALGSLGSIPLIKSLDRSNQKKKALQRGQVVDQVALPPADEAEQVPFELRESIGSICASILLSRSDQRPRVIVVTSATHSEGKTTLVSELGRAFASRGSKTLLVEADLRKPDLSRTFSISGENGLSLYLAGLLPSAPRIQETSIPNLFVAPGGPVPPNPAALLHSEKLDEFLKAAASDYQIVILDAPPLLSIADARILGSKADGVVLVVRAGRTSKVLVRRASALLEQAGANVLGMVLNGWKPDRAELSHYRYYSAA